MTTTEPNAITAVRPVTVWVPGRPAPQGSKKAIPRQGRGGRIAVSLVESSKEVKPWREDIRWHFLSMPSHVRDAWPIQGPVSVDLLFILKRPVSTPKRRTPPAVKKPDVDKLTRAVFDAITSAGVYGDDSQVIETGVRKRLANLDEAPGCRIAIRTVPEGEWDNWE